MPLCDYFSSWKVELVSMARHSSKLKMVKILHILKFALPVPFLLYFIIIISLFLI
jgi:hypothetical protein